MKKLYLILGIGCVVLILAIVILLLRSPEDNWIKDAKGVWIKHGNPSIIPVEVKAQQEAIICANGLYNQNYNETFSSQCLGSCGDYSVDLVHVPRQEIDNKIENQCEDYRTRKTTYFIELDNKGGLVRVV